MSRPLRLALVLILLTSSALGAARTRAGYAWAKLCTLYPPFKTNIETDRPSPDAAGEALQEFVEKFPKAPESAKALYLLGQCHYSRGEASAAVKAYWQCVERFPKAEVAEDAAFGIVRVYGVARMWDAGRKQIDGLAKKLPKPGFAANLKRRFYALEHLQVGQPAIPFQVKDIDGRPLSLKQYRGKVVLLVFWATWCPHCVREVDHILDALKSIASRQVVVVSISLDQDVARLRGFCRDKGIAWRHHCDGKRYQGAVPLLYDITKIPQLFLIDRKGILRYRDTRGPLIAPRLKKLLDD